MLVSPVANSSVSKPQPAAGLVADRDAAAMETLSL